MSTQSSGRWSAGATCRDRVGAVARRPMSHATKPPASSGSPSPTPAARSSTAGRAAGEAMQRRERVRERGVARRRRRGYRRREVVRRDDDAVLRPLRLGDEDGARRPRRRSAHREHACTRLFDAASSSTPLSQRRSRSKDLRRSPSSSCAGALVDRHRHRRVDRRGEPAASALVLDHGDVGRRRDGGWTAPSAVR